MDTYLNDDASAARQCRYLYTLDTGPNTRRQQSCLGRVCSLAHPSRLVFSHQSLLRSLSVYLYTCKAIDRSVKELFTPCARYLLFYYLARLPIAAPAATVNVLIRHHSGTQTHCHPHTHSYTLLVLNGIGTIHLDLFIGNEKELLPSLHFYHNQVPAIPPQIS